MPPHRTLSTYISANLVIEHGFRAATLKDLMPIANIKDEQVRKNISKVNIFDSVISLESNSSKNFVFYGVSDYERYHLERIYENSTVLSAKKPISKTELEMIIFKFRTKLLEMFLQFNDDFFNDELDFDIMNKKKEIDKVVSQTIHAGVYISENSTANIKDSQIVSGNNNVINISPQSKKDLEEIISQIENIIKRLNKTIVILLMRFQK